MALALIAVVLVLTTAIGLLAGAQAARGQAQAAADLGALAGASRLARDLTAGSPPGDLSACAVAAEAVRRNRGHLLVCEIERGHVVRITATRAAVAGTATATARAGPVTAR